MFNKSFDLVAAVRNMALSVRKHVLLSLVGSVNASIVGGADKLATQLIADGYTHNDLRDMEPREITELMQTVDFQGDVGGTKLRKLSALGNVLRPMLRQADGRDSDELGSLSATIDMMVGTQRMRPVANNAVAILSAVGVEVTAEQIEQTRIARRELDQARANDRAARRGFIEWAIDNCFNEVADNDDDPDVFGDLDVDTREQLTNKMFAALNKGVTTATQNVLMGVTNPNALGLCDISLMKDLHAELMTQAYIVDTPKPKADGPGAAGGKVRRVKKTAATA